MDAVKSARRVFEILEYFAQVQRAVPVAELSAEYGYPPSSVSALMRTMVMLGYLSYDGSARTYLPTARLPFLAGWIGTRLYESESVRAIMRTLSQQTGETIVLAAQNGARAQYLEILDATGPVRLHATAGSFRALAHTAVGLALLSRLRDAKLGPLLRRINSEEPDAGQRVQLSALRARLERVRRDGYAFSLDGVVAGAGAIALLLPARFGVTPLALGIASGRAGSRAEPRTLHRGDAGRGRPAGGRVGRGCLAAPKRQEREETGMNLRQMEVFHAIMRAGSVTGAARLLNVTQPAVSTVLRHCEAQLRVRLFDRTGGRLHPTPEAHAIYPDIANIFQRVDTVTRMTQDLVGGRLGQITVAATFTAANGPIAASVAEFAQKRPAVRVAIHALPSAQVIDRVARREADFGLCYAPARDPAIEVEELSSSEVAAILPRAHPLARLETIPVEALAGQEIITYAPHTAVGKLVEEAFRQARITPTQRLQVNYSMTAFILAAQGAGIALVEPLLLASANTPSLIARPIQPRMEVRTLLIHAIGRPPTKTSTRLLELIRLNFEHMDQIARSPAIT